RGRWVPPLSAGPLPPDDRVGPANEGSVGPMEVVRWERHPMLRRPLLVVAFEGWNDAGDAATLALDYLAEAWGARRFASIDPEEFYDFTATRPQVKLGEGQARTIDRA